MATLNDDRIAAITMGRITRSVGYREGNLTQERTRVLDYYNGEKPAQLNKGRSRYVSHDVFEAVESMKAQLLETFSGSLQPVRFMPQGPNDVEEARVATEVVNFVVDRQNDGFAIKDAVIHDALLGRVGVVKVWWEKDEAESEQTFEGEDITSDDLVAFVSQHADADSVEVEQDPETGAMTSATVKTKTDTSRVRIAVVPGEEFGVSSGSRSLEEANIVYHRTTKTRGELVAMGFDAKVVADLPSGTDWLRDFEAQARAGDADPIIWESSADDQEAGTQVEVFECYEKLALDDGPTSSRKLYKVVLAGGKVLDKEPVKRQPFILWAPLRRSHTIWGENFASRIISTQNARTALMRGILDHTAVTITPRWQVARGGLHDPKELMDNRLGGIVNVSSLDKVAPLPTPPLNPFVFQSVAMLGEEGESLTGISKLSQGLNKDAISKQNSAAMVEQLASMSQVRQKVIARRFAEFLSDLYLVTWELLIENQASDLAVEVAGKWVDVKPSLMRAREHLVIDFALGYGDKAQEAQKYVEIDQYLAADPRLAPQYGPQQRYTVISRALEAKGIKDTSAVLAPPPQQPPPPSPAEQLQMEKVKADIAMQNAQAQASVQRIQLEAQKLQAQHQLDMLEMQVKQQEAMAKLKLQAEAQAHKQLVDMAELRLAQDVASAGGMKGEAIVSPRP